MLLHIDSGRGNFLEQLGQQITDATVSLNNVAAQFAQERVEASGVQLRLADAVA